jgi:hypothetical protein
VAVRALVHRPFHLIAFALTAILLWGSFDAAGWTLLPERFRPARAWLDALMATIFLGGAIELLQFALYHNPMEWWDVRDDAMGATAAILLVHAIRAAYASSITNPNDKE